MEPAAAHRSPLAARAWAMLLAVGLAGCGGSALSGAAPRDAAGSDATTSPNLSDAGADLDDRIGPIDLAQAPTTLGLTCDGPAAAALAFEMPCLVGMNLAGDRSKAGMHVTECRVVQAGRPVAWSFILPLGAVAKDPGMVLRIPQDVPSPPSPGVIDLHGERAQVSSVTGTLSFSRVDPMGRAFIGAFVGTITWKSASGSEATCAVTGPFWGAPGGFI